MKGWPLALALLLLGCDRSPATGSGLRREGRFGSLRDFVLYERSAAAGGSFFLDRFEVTRDDWDGYVGRSRDQAAIDDVDGSLPQLGVDLQQARRFAQWRFGRLPRQDEWQFAATSGGRDDFPWGSVWRSDCANTLDLQLGEPTPVGTFESGRKGEGPYDLIGNAAEWTETVPPQFLQWGSGSLVGAEIMRWKLQRTPALMVWLRPWSPVPALWLVEAMDAQVPRLVVGADYLTPMGQTPRTSVLQVPRLPAEIDPAWGLRLATDPTSVLRALCDYEPALTVSEAALVRAFVGRDRHRGVLAAAFAEVAPKLSPEAKAHGITGLLRAELGP